MSKRKDRPVPLNAGDLKRVLDGALKQGPLREDGPVLISSPMGVHEVTWAFATQFGLTLRIEEAR